MPDDTIPQPRSGARDFLAWWPEALGALLVFVSRVVTAPRTFWESDEFLFASAVKGFDPWSSHPHPPGYPLYVGLGKLFNAVTSDPFTALVSLSVVSSVIGFLALAAAFRKILDDRTLGVCGALFFYFTPAMLVHGTLPLSDGPSIMFVALVLYIATRFPEGARQSSAIALGLACSAAIGTRPQLAVVLVPMLFGLLIWTRNVRKIVAGLIAFSVLSISWFAPLIDAAGGWQKLFQWETRQAAYVAAHDAAASRGARSAGMIVARFLAHPFGPKWITLPVFAVSILGLVGIARIPKKRLLVAPAFFTIAYFALAVEVMDPADAVRYSLPHMIGIALLFTAGLAVIRSGAGLRPVPLVVVVIGAAAAFVYSAPILRARTTRPSPPVAAADFIKRSFPQHTNVLYDLSMRPAAEYLLMSDRISPIETGLRQVYDRERMPVILYENGGSTDPDTRVFSWPDSDAYGKLTRNQYRVVTVDPMRPPERYLPEKGVYDLERTPAGEEWRWLSPDALIRLPDIRGVSDVVVVLRLSHDTPYDSNEMRIFADGREVARANVTKTASAVSIPLRAATQTELRFVAQKSFAPAAVLHNRDPRILSVQLLRIERK